MVKMSRTAPPKRPIPGGVIRKCHCYVLEPIQSSLNRESSEMESGSYNPATPLPTTPPPISNSHTNHARIEISPFRPPTALTKGEKTRSSWREANPQQGHFFIRTIVIISISIVEGPISLPTLWAGDKKAPGARRNTPHWPTGPSTEQEGEVHQQEAPVRSVVIWVTHQQEPVHLP